MGVDCRYYPPIGARVEAVAEAIGVLLGEPVVRRELSGGGVATLVPSVRYRTHDDMPDYVQVVISREHSFNWHQHSDEFVGRAVLTARSTPTVVALFRRLCDFFGGDVWHADVDEFAVDYSRPAHDPIYPTDGEPWQAFQDELAALPPLTDDEIAAARPFAAYPQEDEP